MLRMAGLDLEQVNIIINQLLYGLYNAIYLILNTNVKNYLLKKKILATHDL